MSEAYPFESDDDIEIRELDLESVDELAEDRITVGELVGENESWRYGHVIVDEAQDLTPMQWRMVMRRVRGRSLTIVGDLAQRSAAGARLWDDVLPAELADAKRQELTVNYRSPVEIHELAVAVLAEFAPDVAPSRAIRSAGFAPLAIRTPTIAATLPEVVGEVLGEVGGQVAVIVADSQADGVRSCYAPCDDRVRVLTPVEAKGLEFDAVILVEPAAVWQSPGGPAQLYIALTRATQRLVMLHADPLPAVLAAR